MSPSDAGLQAERTGLAWSRTSLGVAANALLLAARELEHTPIGLGVVPAALATLVAAATAVYGRRRNRQLRGGPLPVPLAADRAIPLLGGAVVVLALLTGVVLLI